MKKQCPTVKRMLTEESNVFITIDY